MNDEPTEDELLALLDDLSPEPSEESLLEAVRYGERRAKLMLRNGSNPNEQDEKGRSALHYAARYAPRLVPVLLDFGADPTSRDARGKLPEELATGPEARAALAAARARADRALLEEEARQVERGSEKTRL